MTVVDHNRCIISFISVLVRTFLTTGNWCLIKLSLSAMLEYHWCAVACLLSWMTQLEHSPSLGRDLSGRYVSAAHNPLTHLNSRSCKTWKLFQPRSERKKNGWMVTDPQFSLSHTNFLLITVVFSVLRYHMWRLLTYGWQCVYCLCLLPC